MLVLVTGANGMLGQDLCTILEDNGYNIIKTDVDNFDITNYDANETLFLKESPDLVIHCAAYTNVDGAENNFDEAYRINSKGTENIAKICAKTETTLVYISTDYVFDGEKNSPYTPTDKPCPINNYGKTKYQGEIAVKKYCKNYYIIRTSWLYGTNGKNFVETMLRLANENKEIRVVNDQIGCPTWTIELANGILNTIRNKPFGIYHICGKGETSWFEFAKEIFRLTDIKIEIKPCRTEDLARSAPRPKYSVLESEKECKNWKLALKEYMALKSRKEGIQK